VSLILRPCQVSVGEEFLYDLQGRLAALAAGRNRPCFSTAIQKCPADAGGAVGLDESHKR
jgi:hypothetical protein